MNRTNAVSEPIVDFVFTLIDDQADRLHQISQWLACPTGDARHICNADTCLMGQWLNQVQNPYILQHTAYRELSEVHARFHQMLYFITILAQSGETRAAQEQVRLAYVMHTYVQNLLMALERDLLANGLADTLTL